MAGAKGTEKTWPFPPEQDSWYRTHDSMRLDMEDFQRALGALHFRTDRGQMIRDWEKVNVALYWQRFVKTLKAHHDYEEHFLFPWLQTRCDFTNKMSQDHVVIVGELGCLSVMMKALCTAETQPEALQAIKELKARYKSFRAHCLEHFRDEEEILVPLMRKHWTYTEAARVKSTTLNQSLKPEDLAEILRPMTHVERKAYLRQEKIPGVKAMLMVLPACKKYDKIYTSALEEVILGERMQHKWGIGVLGSYLKNIAHGIRSSRSTTGSSLGSTDDLEHTISFALNEHIPNHSNDTETATNTEFLPTTPSFECKSSSGSQEKDPPRPMTTESVPLPYGNPNVGPMGDNPPPPPAYARAPSFRCCRPGGSSKASLPITVGYAPPPPKFKFSHPRAAGGKPYPGVVTNGDRGVAEGGIGVSGTPPVTTPATPVQDNPDERGVNGSLMGPRVDEVHTEFQSLGFHSPDLSQRGSTDGGESFHNKGAVGRRISFDEDMDPEQVLHLLQAMKNMHLHVHMGLRTQSMDSNASSVMSSPSMAGQRTDVQPPSLHAHAD